MSNFKESSQSRDRSNSKKPFNENNNYHSPHQIHNFRDDDIPGEYTNNAYELFNLNSISLRLNKIQLYINLYQHPVGDKNKNNALETQFLLNTGATCSLINFDSYEQYCKIQPLQLNKSRSNTVAVNGEKLKLIGYTNFDSTFGKNTDNPIKIKA